MPQVVVKVGPWGGIETTPQNYIVPAGRKEVNISVHVSGIEFTDADPDEPELRQLTDPPKNVLKVGPWGLYIDSNKEYLLADGRRLTKITVYTNKYVSGVEFTDIDLNGNQHLTTIGVTTGEPQSYVITPAQRITAISGSVASDNIIKSLHFEISKYRNHDGQHGTFSVPVNWCRVSGFYGHHNGDFFVMWGAYLSPDN